MSNNTSAMEQVLAQLASALELDEVTVVEIEGNPKNCETLKPEFPEMAIKSKRAATFKFWPIQITQKPSELCDAGFFYTERSDRVVCYFCGGGLFKWFEDDDPWEEHALFYSHCAHVKVMKGEKFIEEVKRKKMAKNSSDLSELTVKQIKDCEKPTKEEKLCDTRLCQICCDAEFDTVFLPCGHVNSCAECALSLSRCPLCQSNVKEIKRIYLP